eukprot:4026960-Prorocentrum_lima.AAC.1
MCRGTTARLQPRSTTPLTGSRPCGAMNLVWSCVLPPPLARSRPGCAMSGRGKSSGRDSGNEH